MKHETRRRYARHLVLSQIGEAGQAKLAAASALVIGAGGLGCNASASLAAAGIGRLGIVEHDRVELSNLQRQLLYEEADIGRAKAQAARDRLNEMNGGCHIDIFEYRLTSDNARELVRDYEIVLDGSDNFATRFAVQDACFHEKKTLISAAISGFSGQLATFKPHMGAPHPCYRCLVPTLPQREVTCAQEGIIGPLAPILASMQALEAIKEVLGLGSLAGFLLLVDALSMEFRKLTLPKDTKCALCGMN